MSSPWSHLHLYPGRRRLATGGIDGAAVAAAAHRHPPKSFLIPKFALASARKLTLISEQYELLILLSPPIFTIQHKDLGLGEGRGEGGVDRSLQTDAIVNVSPKPSTLFDRKTKKSKKL